MSLARSFFSLFFLYLCRLPYINIPTNSIMKVVGQKPHSITSRLGMCQCMPRSFDQYQTTTTIFIHCP